MVKKLACAVQPRLIFANFRRFAERTPHWSPVKERPHWSPRHEMEHREPAEYRHKYEQAPRIERPKMYPKSKVGAKPSQRTVVPKGSPDDPKPRMGLKQAEPKPKATVTMQTKEQDQQQSQSDVAKKTVAQGPSSDEINTATEGYYELSPLMSKILESELQDLMIKVWQALPDSPNDDAEKLVVNRLRNKADDDLRNVFGLNVSKRLLNVFNIFYIKIQFTAKPKGQNLAKFLRKHDITNFKWNHHPLAYTAVVKNINDFDMLCSTRVFIISGVRVIITPLYQFLKCPSKLRTSYHVSGYRSMNVPFNISEEPAGSSKTSEPKETVADAANVEEIKETVKDKDARDIKQTNVKTSPKNVEKQSIITPEKKAINTKTAGKQQTISPKTAPVKKEAVKKNIIDKKPKLSGRNILEEGDEFDELDDDEIMALVSQGIVLDECSGSDTEM